MMKRKDVYVVIDEERAYQDSLQKKGTFETRVHPVAAEILMIQQYAQKAAADWTGTFGDEAGLHQVRKIAALCIRCMENHGAPRRAVPPKDVVVNVEGKAVKRGSAEDDRTWGRRKKR